MNEELTKEDIIAIAARRAAISDQPLWEASTDWHWDVGIYGVWAEGRSHFTTSGDATEDEMKAALVLAEADAVFIANAPTDIDALLAALEAERADNERLRARVAELEAPREGILADTQARRYGDECEQCAYCDGSGWDGTTTCEACLGSGCFTAY